MKTWSKILLCGFITFVVVVVALIGVLRHKRLQEKKNIHLFIGQVVNSILEDTAFYKKHVYAERIIEEVQNNREGVSINYVIKVNDYSWGIYEAQILFDNKTKIDIDVGFHDGKPVLYHFTNFARKKKCMNPAEREQKLIESKQELIENPGNMCRFTANKNYQEVYRITKAALLDTPIKEEEIKAELRTNIEQAEITIQLSGLFDVSTILHVKIKALSPETSEFIAYCSYEYKYKHNQKSFCAEMKQFIEK